MADGFDRFNQDLRSSEGGGGSFVMGLLTGTVLGAGLGMLFAPRAGSELRGQLSEQAAKVGNTASEGVRRATESASQWAERGREVYNKASEAVAKGTEEAQKYVRDTSAAYTGSESAPSTGSSGPSSTGSSYRSPESIRGGSITETPSSTGPRKS
jgi:gas vesicle protein